MVDSVVYSNVYSHEWVDDFARVSTLPCDDFVNWQLGFGAIIIYIRISRLKHLTTTNLTFS